MKPRPPAVRRWEALPIRRGRLVAKQSRICGRTFEYLKTRLAHSAPKGPRTVAGGGAKIAEGDTSGAPGTRTRPEEPRRGEGEDGSAQMIDSFYSVAPSGLGPLGAPTGGSLRSPPATLRQPFGLLRPVAAEAFDRGRSQTIKTEAHSVRARRLFRNPPAAHPLGILHAPSGEASPEGQALDFTFGRQTFILPSAQSTIGNRKPACRQAGRKPKELP